MRVTIAQLNPLVGDLEGNLQRVLEALPQAQAEGAELIVFSELLLTGYPPRDLLNHGHFRLAVQETLAQLLAASRDYPGLGILVGLPVPTGQATGRGLYNAAVLVADGHLVGTRAKTLLPTYDVFDEDRYFDSAPSIEPLAFAGERLGISVCEDAWSDSELAPAERSYQTDPIAELAAAGATVLINLSASPYQVGKEQVRHDLITRHARQHGLPFVYVNQVGGNDELVFDGRSLACDGQGHPLAVLPGFAEGLTTLDTTAAGEPGRYVAAEPIATVGDALVLGLRDYLRKCGFSRTVIGLSGGIDSAVVCVLAVQALGAANVMGLAMPSRYSSPGSVNDANRLAQNLGIAFQIVSIDPVFEAYEKTLQELFAGTPPGVAEENIQSRIRGNLLMALSNKYGSLVLSTGNKSELAVGYGTLYGDMSGGLSVLADVPKGLVYELAHYLNREGEVIPPDSLTKAPSAELRPDQTDQDTLPPYPVLDQIIQLYVEEQRCAAEIIATGLEAEVVHWVIRTIDRNEYKRRQAAPGLRVTSKAFGMGRRMPIAAKPPR